MGITEEELAECIQLAASVGAGTIGIGTGNRWFEYFNLTKALEETKI
jgi:hypothetical protein